MAGIEHERRDSFASLAKRGDFPFRAISWITEDENSLDIAAICSDAKSEILMLWVVRLIATSP